MKSIMFSRLWLWCYEMIWYVKGYFSHNDDVYEKLWFKWKVNSHFMMLDPCDQWCSRANSYDYEP